MVRFVSDAAESFWCCQQGGEGEERPGRNGEMRPVVIKTRG